jgi:hypothetical protein
LLLLLLLLEAQGVLRLVLCLLPRSALVDLLLYVLHICSRPGLLLWQGGWGLPVTLLLLLLLLLLGMVLPSECIILGSSLREQCPHIHVGHV